LCWSMALRRKRYSDGLITFFHLLMNKLILYLRMLFLSIAPFQIAVGIHVCLPSVAKPLWCYTLGDPG
jgi:hypothetical protein